MRLVVKIGVYGSRAPPALNRSYIGSNQLHERDGVNEAREYWQSWRFAVVPGDVHS